VRLPLPASVCLFLLATGLCGAQSDPPGRYQFRTYTSDDGLDNLAINAIVQDRVGFLWVGTEDGLYRYDGERFYRVSDGAGFPSAVTSLVEDSGGRIWIGTYETLAVLDAGEVRVAKDAGTALHARINALAAAGGLVFAATSEGLVRIDAGGHFRNLGSLSNRGAASVWADRDGTLSVGEDGAIRTLLPGGHWQTRTGFGGERILSIARDGSGSLWARSSRHLWMLRPGSAAFTDESSILTGGTETASLTVDPDGSLWVPTTRGLLHTIADGWEVLGGDQGLPTGWASHAFVDREGSLWVGSTGLHQLLGRGLWRSHTARDGLPAEVVWSVLRDPAGDLWVGTERGAVRSQGGAWHAVAGTERHVIRSIVRTPDGAMWMAGSPAELLRFDPRTRAVERFGPDAGITGTQVLKLFLAGDGRLWVATSEGLLRRADGPGRPRFETVAVPGGAPVERFSSIAEDSTGRLWAAGRQGMAVLERGSWRRLTKKDGLRLDAVAYVLHRKNGETCTTYFEAIGITCFRYGGGKLSSVHHIDVSNGLQNGRVYLVGEDSAGRLWVGTGKGVDVIGPLGIDHFDARQGLVGDDTSAMAFLSEADSTVWIGTSSGLSRFAGSDYHGPSGAPVSVLLQTHVDTHGGAFDVQFAGLAFAHRGLVRNEIRLVPMEQEWRRSDVREARYTHLPPGDYTFELRSQIGSGPFSETTRVGFRILPAWWQTFWFRALVALAFGALVLSAIVWRNRAADVRRTREARARTEASFRALIERTPDAILVHRGGQLVYVNPAAAQMLGYESTDALCGKPLLDLVHPDDHAAVRERIMSVSSTGKPSPLQEKRLLRRDGATVVVELAGLAVDFAGERCILAVARDVTERKQLQSRLLLSDRMASIGTLAAGVAHEVNNPLACVKGNLDFLAEALRDPGTPATEVLAAIDDARDGAERVRKIVRGLKLFSRADEEQRRPLELERVLEVAVRMCSNEIRHRATLVKEYHPAPMVHADESRLAQVFINLLANAAQAIREGYADQNEIRVITRTDEAGWAVVEVTDTGHGMPSEVIGHVFDPFFTTKPVG